MTGRKNHNRVTWQQAEAASLAPKSHEISELERILKVIRLTSSSIDGHLASAQPFLTIILAEVASYV